MTLTELRYIVTLAQESHFGRAAERCHVSQPTLSVGVKKLEDEGHDTSDWKAACEKALEWGVTIYTGLFLQREQPTLSDLEPVLKEGGPLARRPLGLSTEYSARIIKRMC